MKFALILNAGHFFFETLSDLTNALQVVNAFEPFTEDCQFNAVAFTENDSIELMIVGIKFSDYISFGLSDESRRALEEFRKGAKAD